ncbi:cysteinyl-tRNA synthetase [Planomicrobium sp. HSC-17F08]|nr:cysteinyl-tRNA synthetase [Planomicrobium sp. HSC-17F08]
MPRKHLIICFLFMALFMVFSGCTPEPAEKGAENPDRKQWHYQLQYTNPAQLAAGGYEIAVIDPTADGSEETRFTKEQLKKMKVNGTKVLAYFSIGEASSYLAYWNPVWGTEQDGVLEVAEEAPKWLGRTPNPDWPESVKVRYWQEEWWDILEPELKKIKKAGFDGVYLDIVDAYYYWGSEVAHVQEQRLASDPKSEAEAAEWMMSLVERISSYMKKDSPDFQVYPQNAESIFTYDKGSYLAAIDGIGAEDLWYDGMEKSKDLEERLLHLKKVRDAGKNVLSVDYVATESPTSEERKRIDYYMQRCTEEEFFCFPAIKDRELDRFIPK